VVATARYSPPEYLFRLLEPGAELWHALNVYQLGALLHDLIMREPLFEVEYLRSADNRYRFAWVVATTDPRLHAEDVDRDLLLTARRGLDKSWKRRSAVAVEHYLADTAVHRANALQVLGVATDRGSVQETDDLTGRLQRARDVANDLQYAVTDYLRKNGVTATHNIRPGQHDTSKLIAFQWDSPGEPPAPSQRIDLEVELHLVAQGDEQRFGLSVKLSMGTGDPGTSVSMALPELQDENGVEAQLLTNVVEAFGQLAMDITRGNDKAEERQSN
jgi:hypothetical protein